MSTFIQHLRRAVLLQDAAGLTDGQLLGCFIDHRDEAAFAALVKRHGPMVWGVCRRLLNHHDAEDAFQAAFLVLFRKAASIVPREMVANWLYGVARQTALQARRTAARRSARERQVTEMPEPAVAAQGLWHDLQPLLDQELCRLPDTHRSVIVLCDLEGKTRKEAARQLGLPEGTVGSRLARARAMLAKRLARHGLAVSGAALAGLLAQQAVSASAPTSVVFSTIKAASLITAGQGAATGAISVKVAALTEGVLKTMLLTKLKIATVVLFVASTVAVTCAVLAKQPQPGLPKDVRAKPQIKPAQPPKRDQDKLQGTWQLLTDETDGVRNGEGTPENKGCRLVIDKACFTLFSKHFYGPDVQKEPDDIKSVGTFTLDTKQTPKVMVMTWEECLWNGKKDFTQRAIYALDGDSLKLCLSMDEEGKKVPTGFSANFGTKCRLMTFKRKPVSDGRGAEKATAQLPQGKQPTGRPKASRSAQADKRKGSKEDKDKLQGTWRMVTQETDGYRYGEGRPDVKDNRLVIEKSSITLSWATKFTLNDKTGELVKAETITLAGTFTLETTQTPKVIVFTWKESPLNPKEDVPQKAIYAVDGDTLKLCLSSGKNAPAEFSANAGSKRALWIFKRDPASKKKGAKRP